MSLFQGCPLREGSTVFASGTSIQDTLYCTVTMLDREMFVNLLYALISIRTELEQWRQSHETKETELASRQNSTRKLEVRLRGVEEEATGLHSRISELDSHKLRLEEEISQLKMSTATLEVEKEGLQRELKSVREVSLIQT